MDYKLQDLIDVSLFQTMLERLNELYPFPITLRDIQGNILSANVSDDVCRKFECAGLFSGAGHTSTSMCFAAHPDPFNSICINQCPHGMIKCAAPVFIEDWHLGDLFTGPVFIRQSDPEYFRKQALLYGFDEESYLEAIQQVPVRTQEELDKYQAVIQSVIEILVHSGKGKLKEIESRKTSLENEDRFKSLFDRAPDAIILADIETGIIVDANYAASKLLGKPVAEIIGMHQLQLHPVRDEQYTRETFQNHAENRKEIGEIPSIENIVLREDGTEVPVEILASTISINGKHIIQGIFRDITGRRKSENIFRIQHEISHILGQTSDLRIALNHLLEIVCQIDGVDCGGIYLADLLTGYFNLVAHQNLSKEFVCQSSPVLAESVNSSLVCSGRSVFMSYSEIQELNISELIQEGLHSISAIPITNNGVVIATFYLASHRYNAIQPDTRIALESIASNLGATISRITSENQLKESEEKYKLAFRTSPDSININSTNGIYVDVNDGFTSLTGYSKDEIIGKSSLDLNMWAILKDREKLIAGLQKDGRCENLESVFRTKTGELKTGLMSASLITINNEPHILSITRDISERKKVEMELIRSKEKAEESDTLKSAFLANLSHELRTPMNGILGFSELLDDDSLTNEERKEYISVINDSGRGLLDVITNIMNISKIDSGQMALKIRSFNLNALLEELMKWFCNEKVLTDKAQLQVELKTVLKDEQSMITSDPGMIRHIFSLLLNNAAKFTSTGSIHFGYALHGQQIRFFVQDTGKGIRADKQKAVFERFRQEDETLSRKYGGVGLGLTIAKGLTELLQGNIWLESEPGKGSTFLFEINCFVSDKTAPLFQSSSTSLFHRENLQ